MADEETTPPPAAAAVGTSSPMTPNPKRTKLGSPDSAEKTSDKPESNPSNENAEVQQAQGGDSKPEHPQTKEVTESAALTTKEDPEDPEDEEDDLEADDEYADSAVGGSEYNSDSTSVSSSIYEGYMENGRRYQSKREGEYWGPSDAKQFESMEKTHIVHCILDSAHKNPAFYSPIGQGAQNILDIGTGTGDWARDVADRFPSALVQGIDLYPTPDNWVPPNCKFEVDDALKPWEFKENGRFDLIHIRYLMGAFSDEQWRLLYKQAYKNLAPGGWIEQIEPSIAFETDDNSVPADSVLKDWGTVFLKCAAKSGRNLNTEETFPARIKAAGFVNLHEKAYKVPLGDWAKSPVLKEAGRFHKAQILQGLEGYAMLLLTHFGDPTPWQPEEVQVYLAKIRAGLNDPSIHVYHRMRRVWAQKPLDSAPKAQ